MEKIIARLLKMFEKLELKLELMASAITAVLVAIFHKLIPASIRHKVELRYIKVKSYIHIKLVQLKNKMISLLLKIKVLLLNSFRRVKQILNFPIQVKVNSFVQKFKVVITPTNLIASTKTRMHFFKPLIEVINKKLSKLGSSHSFILGTAFGLTAIGLMSIYFSSQNIYEKEFPDRSPANIQEYDYRPDYLKYDLKTVQVQNMRVPLLVEKEGKVSSVTVDFSIRTSTKFAKIYLEEYEHKLKDYFYTRVEPILSDFIMTPEGKDILKEKIQDEINIFLKEQGVEGNVDEVTVQFIIGS